ncbi:MAG: DUF6218 family protein [Kibdelosporangium sp.]
MTSEPTAEPLGLLATRAGDGRTMIGHVIVCRSQPADTIAIWHVDTEGAKTWAWVTTTGSTDRAEARLLLAQCKQRAIVGWDPLEAIEILRMLERTAGTNPVDWNACAIAIPDVMAEISRVRVAYQERVVLEQSVKKNVADLDWPSNLEGPLPGTPDELYRVTRFAHFDAPTVAATEALRTARLVEWLVQQWRRTVVAVARRDYLRATFGEPTVLPPLWEARLADAFAKQH